MAVITTAPEEPNPNSDFERIAECVEQTILVRGDSFNVIRTITELCLSA